MTLSVPVVLGLVLPIWIAGAPPGEVTRVRQDRGRMLVGTQRGLYTYGADGWVLQLARGGVLDIAGSADGWLIAAADGLYEWASGDASPRPVSLSAGARPRSVAVDHSRRAWVATDSGLFCRSPGSPKAGGFRRITTLPMGEVQSVETVRAAAGAGPEVWVAAAGTLWSRDAGGEFTPRLRGLDPGWWELVGAAHTSAGLLLAVPEGLWRVAGGRSTRVELAAGEVRSIATRGDQLWIASSRGVLRTSAADVGQRLPHLVLAAEAFDLSSRADALVAATVRGIAEIPLPASASPLHQAPALRAAPGRSVEPALLHRAVLSYQGLGVGDMRRLERRLRNAAWLPVVRLSAGASRDRAHQLDRDQTFSSGDVRRLVDSTRDSDASLDLTLSLTWDLDRLLDPDDAIAVSRERRERIELRDQVLERVNRLYFERARARAALAALPQGDEAGRVELEIRARELEASLDAWTGGVFSRLESDSPRPTGSPP